MITIPAPLSAGLIIIFVLDFSVSRANFSSFVRLWKVGFIGGKAVRFAMLTVVNVSIFECVWLGIQVDGFLNVLLGTPSTLV